MHYAMIELERNNCMQVICDRYYRYHDGEDGTSHKQINHDDNTFSILSEKHSHTYRTSKMCIPHIDLIKQLDNDLPVADV